MAIDYFSFDGIHTYAYLLWFGHGHFLKTIMLLPVCKTSWEIVSYEMYPSVGELVSVIFLNYEDFGHSTLTL